MGKTISIGGRDLATARRAVSVWLMTDLHRASDTGPSWGEVFALLEHLDWPGSAEHPIELVPERRRVLERVVFDTLEVAASEGTRAAHLCLLMGAEPGPADVRTLRALERLAGLAACLVDPEADADADAVADSAFRTEPVSDGFASLADGLGLPIWVADRDFEVLWVNEACEHLFRADRAALVGSSVHDWWATDDRQRATSSASAAQMEHRAFSVRGAVSVGDGPEVPALSVAVPRRCPAGELLGWAGVWFADSAVRPSAGWVAEVEGSQTASAATLHMLLDQLPGMIWTTDRDLRCTSSLGAGLRELGLRPNQTVGVTFCEFVGTHDRDHPARRAHVAALDGEAGAYRDRRGDRTYEVRVEPLRGAEGSVVGVVGISRDITDAVRRDVAQATLLRQLNFAQSVSGIGSWECDLATGEWLWSDEGYRLLGYEPGEITPSFETFMARVHPDDRAAVGARHAEAMRTGNEYEVSYRVALPDGTSHRLSGVVRFDWGEDEVLARVAGLIRRVEP